MTPSPVAPLFRALVADDEPLARANVRALLAPCSRWHPVEEAASGTATLVALTANPPDALFLDIRMPGLDGLQVAQRLGALERPPLVVFVTAFEHHALEAFDLDAVDYLLKPLTVDRFGRMLRRLESRLDQRHQGPSSPVEASEAPPSEDVSQALDAAQTPDLPLRRLVVRSAKRIRFVDTETLVWIGAAGNYVRLYLESTCLLHRATLASLERQLDASKFLRVQRGAIVRRDAITEVRIPAPGRHLLVLREGSEVEVSQRYAKRVLATLGAGPGS